MGTTYSIRVLFATGIGCGVFVTWRLRNNVAFAEECIKPAKQEWPHSGFFSGYDHARQAA